MTSFLENHWGSKLIASRGKLTDASVIPRILAIDDDEIVGLATLVINANMRECELITIDSIMSHQGIGSALIKKVEAQAKQSGCRKVWLITVNSNPEAAIFYVKNGYRLIAVHLDALQESRRLKPQIPLEDSRGIPLQDEWEFAKML